MLTLPGSNSSLLVRTDFTGDDAWDQVSAEALQESEDGFRAYIQPISDLAFAGATWEAVKAALPTDNQCTAVLFVADSVALTLPDHPILVVDLLNDRQPFRCIPSELWAVDNNLNLANLDWEDFAGAADDEGGIFRGFSE
jgi:hypothetical protein